MYITECLKLNPIDEEGVTRITRQLFHGNKTKHSLLSDTRALKVLDQNYLKI